MYEMIKNFFFFDLEQLQNLPQMKLPAHPVRTGQARRGFPGT
jgi:hypothetical protein